MIFVLIFISGSHILSDIKRIQHHAGIMPSCPCLFHSTPHHGHQQLMDTWNTSQLDYRYALQSDLHLSLATHLQTVQKLAAGFHFYSSSHHFIMFPQFTVSFTIDKSIQNSKRHLNGELNERENITINLQQVHVTQLHFAIDSPYIKMV